MVEVPFISRVIFLLLWAGDKLLPGDNIELPKPLEMKYRKYKKYPLALRIMLPAAFRGLRGSNKQFWNTLNEVPEAAESRHARKTLPRLMAHLQEIRQTDPNIPFSAECLECCRVLMQASVVEDSRDVAAMSSPLQAFGDSSHMKRLVTIKGLLSPRFSSAYRLLVITSRATEQALSTLSPHDSEKIQNILNKRLRALKRLSARCQKSLNCIDPLSRLLFQSLVEWISVLETDGSRLREALSVEPVPNPYVVGNPVRGSLFVGREDILQQLALLWSASEQRPSVVLFGHRRMGKTSILHNLATLKLPRPFVVVDFNMAVAANVGQTSELLYGLALALYDAARSRKVEIAEPQREHFRDGNPYGALNRFLRQLECVCGELLFLVTVDEFETIEERIEERILDPQLLSAFRAMFQTYPWLTMVFAGLHTLDEMCRDYWHPLFGSVQPIEVGFLKAGAASELIINPLPNFPLRYTDEAVREIIALTHGQPYLIQFVCHGLVSRYNQQIMEPRLPPPRSFTVSDVQAVLDSPELFGHSANYFEGVWRQARSTHPNGEVLLRCLSAHPTGMSLDELALKLGLPRSAVNEGVAARARRTVVELTGDKALIAVELLRRWIASLQFAASPSAPSAMSLPEQTNPEGLLLAS